MAKNLPAKQELLLLLSRLQSCPTLCDPIDSSPPGSSVPRILQARILEWVAISFSSKAGDLGSILGLGRSPGEGNGYPHQYSWPENPMDRGAWRAIVHGVTKSGTRLSYSHTHTYKVCTCTHTHIVCTSNGLQISYIMLLLTQLPLSLVFLPSHSFCSVPLPPTILAP